MVQSGRPQMATRPTHISRCIPKATNTHSEYVIVIAFPQEQWLHERALMLRHTCIASLVLLSLYPFLNLGLLNWKFDSFVRLEHHNICI